MTKAATHLFLLVSLPVILLSCNRDPLEISARDYGAIPDDHKNDVQAILSALKACKSLKCSRLVFEFGSYDINGSQKDNRGNFEPAIQVQKIDNLTLDGNGCQFIGHDYSTLFHFTECDNLTITNLCVDWDPLPYTQGKVVHADTNYIDIEVVDPFIAKSGLTTQAILGYDIEHHRMARRYTDHYQLGFPKTTEVIRPGVMRLFTGRQDRFAGTMPSEGMYVIARHQVYGYQSFEFERCSSVKMENVNIFCNPGMGVVGEKCNDITIRHLKIMIKPGSLRWMSCTADATNFRGCRGTILMENCLFEGQGDDATNVRSGEYMLVDGRSGDDKLVIKTGYRYGGDPDPPETGDKLEISGKDKPLLPYSVLTVKSVEINQHDRSLIVGFSGKLPERAGKGDIVGNASSCPVLRIRNCTAIRNRARGFVIKTRDVIIEDCTFQDICASGVALEADINAWWESIGSHDVIIRNNRFIDCKFEPEYLQGVIESHTMSQTAPAGVHRRISIENNIFLGSDGNILKLGSADGVEITDNIMDHPRNEAILLYNTRNVRITGNVLTNCITALKLGDGCDQPTIFFENNTGF